MAKGDDSRSRNRIEQQGGLAQNHLDNLRTDMLVPQAQQAQNYWTRSADRSFDDFGNIMGQYQNFADTGGYSGQDIANIRARSVSPIRSIYANANRDIDRQKSLQGGYSPNYTASKAKMAREMSYALGDMNTNVEAGLAQMINEGKRFGTQGQAGLFGTAPGMAGMFGNQSNAAMNNWLQGQGLQNQLSLGTMGAQINASQIPGKWENTMGRIGDVANIVGGVASIPWGGSGIKAVNNNPFGNKLTF